MSKSEYQKFLRNQFAAWFLEIKVVMLIALMAALPIFIMLNASSFIEQYYPGYNDSILYDKHSPYIATYAFLCFLSWMFLVPLYFFPLLFMITQYHIKSVRQQAQEKISGMARITIVRWKNSKDIQWYATVPDRQDRLWSFIFTTNIFMGYIEAGEFPAEIYFREAIESPALVIVTIKKTQTLLLPASCPKMQEAPSPPQTPDTPIESFCKWFFGKF